MGQLKSARNGLIWLHSSVALKVAKLTFESRQVGQVSWKVIRQLHTERTSHHIQPFSCNWLHQCVNSLMLIKSSYVKTDPVSQTSCLIKLMMTDNVQNNSHIYCYKPVSHQVVIETVPVSEMLCLKKFQDYRPCQEYNSHIYCYIYQCQKYLDLA